ncbi:MAG: DUF2071 domain-containing protein [Flavobacteriales bacterium]|jgi:uncharacterized protein YqjF (DUF2071 family)|nr:DUF2071 domain-containing protein [Flavobacteriales bacterium]
MSFLKAEWRKLAIINYEVNPKILEPYLPFGTELDLWEGKCYVSVVGFMFLNTRVMGLKVPNHINFEEVNLRFYVKRITENEIKRGVVFIKEIVPRQMITFIANSLYNENYETMKMDYLWEKKEACRSVEYQWKKQKDWNKVKIIASLNSVDLASGSKTEFITEHYWGYAKVSDKKTTEYEVTHPKWNVYEVLDYNIQINFSEIYGETFAFLNNQKPSSVMLAEGSEITVENKSIIKK